MTVWVEILGFVFGQFGQNFQKCFRVFLNSMDSPLSLESSHMPVNRIWGPHIF